MEQELILIRHGKPLSATNDVMGACEFVQWIRRYNQSDLDPASRPRTYYDLSDHYIFTSNLKRARLSAFAYGVSRIERQEPLLREMDIPYYRFGIKLRAWHWVVFNRAQWFAGRRGNFESFYEARERVRQATDLLEDTVSQQQKVAVFGHGMSNRYIRLELVKRGWSLHEKDDAFWGVNRLTRRLEPQLKSTGTFRKTLL